MASKREKILETSMALFQEQGYEKTSVSQIVKQAGMAQGTFYLYFKSKNALVSAIANKIFDEQLEIIRTSYDKKDRNLDSLLNSMIDATFAITEKHKDVISFLYSGFAYDQSFSTWEEIYRPYYEWLEDALHIILERDEGSTSNSLSHLSNFIVGLVEHGAETCYLSGLPKEEITAYRNDLLAFLHGSISTMSGNNNQ